MPSLGRNCVQSSCSCFDARPIRSRYSCDQPKVSVSHGRVDDEPIGTRRDEQVLDHAVRAEQVEAIQKQLGIRRDALTDRVCQLEPSLVVAAMSGVLIRLEQRHETLDQRRQIEGIRFARAQDQAVLVERHALLRGDVAELRA